MGKKQKREKRNQLEKTAAPAAAAPAASSDDGWLGARSNLLLLAGVVLAGLVTFAIYGQTLSVPAIDYEDTFYLTRSPYVNVAAPLSRLDAVWKEPYFANYHPLTTTTWLIDRMMADKAGPFDAHPFRSMHVFYLAVGAALLILLFRQLGITPVLAVLGAALFAAHPPKTEIGGWLSARKDVIVLITAVLSFACYLKARKSQTVKAWWFWHALTAILNLAAVLSKPIAVVLPALFVAWEFCSDGARKTPAGRLSPALTRTLGMGAIMAVVGGPLALVLSSSLANQPSTGALRIAVPIVLALGLIVAAPDVRRLRSFLDGTDSGLRVLGPPAAVHAVIFASGVAWTMWAQSAVGAIKSGLSLIPTLNLSSDVLLAYIGKTFVPLRLSVSYTWTSYPYVSVGGALGAAAALGFVALAVWLARHANANLRLVAFGIFWFLICFIPVSNLTPTSTKMADRYLMLPAVGAIIAVCGAISWFAANRRPRQMAALAALLATTGAYTAWARQRTAVWCGTTTLWEGKPHPDLSLWTAAVDTHPDDFLAMTNLATVYLGFTPPQTDKAIALLRRALDLGDAGKLKIADGRVFDTTPMIEGLADAYLDQARGFGTEPGAAERKHEALREAVKYFELANSHPSGFAPMRAHFLRNMADAQEDLARLEPPARRDALRSRAVQALEEARRVLVTAAISKEDPDFRNTFLALGTLYFGRESDASPQEKAIIFRKAAAAYEDTAGLFPDDPRPVAYMGLSYQRLRLLADSAAEKQRYFDLADAALKKALTLRTPFAEYHPLTPYRALATLYSEAGDYRGALDFLKTVKEKDPAYSQSSGTDRDIQTLEQLVGVRR